MPSMRGSSISGESPESVLKITGCTPDGIKRVTKKQMGTSMKIRMPKTLA